MLYDRLGPARMPVRPVQSIRCNGAGSTSTTSTPVPEQRRSPRTCSPAVRIPTGSRFVRIACRARLTRVDAIEPDYREDFNRSRRHEPSATRAPPRMRGPLAGADSSSPDHHHRPIRLSRLARAGADEMTSHYCSGITGPDRAATRAARIRLLACYCPLDQPCRANVFRPLAKRERQEHEQKIKQAAPQGSTTGHVIPRRADRTQSRQHAADLDPVSSSTGFRAGSKRQQARPSQPAGDSAEDMAGPGVAEHHQHRRQSCTTKSNSNHRSSTRPRTLTGVGGLRGDGARLHARPARQR